MNNSFAEASGPSTTASSSSHEVLRQVLSSDKVSDSQVSQYYRERLQDRRIQITNLDRARPKTGGNDADARLRAEAKLVKRKRRVKSELSQLKRLRIAAGRAAKRPWKEQDLHEGQDEGASDDEANKNVVKGKQRLLADTAAQLKRLQSTSHHHQPRSNPAKKLDKSTTTTPLTRAQRKRLNLDSLDSSISYHLVEPLHEMWRTYIQQLLNITAMNSKGQVVANPQFDPKALVTMSSGTVSAVQASLIKADLCGAEVEVVRAANPSLVGKRGLVVKETEHTLVLVTAPKRDEGETKRGRESGGTTKTVPKKNAVFAIKVPLATPASQDGESAHLRFELHGNHMMHTLPSRATRKYKARPTIDF